ncbi:MAG: hypothetical protein IKB75_01905 [Clostridia bacterium]|nr:hypothetical protein [Clostridia bacterium]
MEPKCYLYVVFSATPYKMGKFLRTVTRGQYNHVSVTSFSDLHELYSFARYYRNTPFWGGFVKESAARYCNGGRVASIRVCAIPIDRKCFDAVQRFLGHIQSTSEDYSYNLPSALCAPIRRRVYLKNSYTCVEFVSDLLIKCHACEELNADEYYTISKLLRRLEAYIVYEGDFPHMYSGYADAFDIRQPIWYATSKTLLQNWNLLFHMVRG